ncbi:MAG TPA: hypothetical protein VGW40_05815 [Allosphingosinicella sp.]|nr:hypothetical protein [Allosphingosinicella sp.]
MTDAPQKFNNLTPAIERVFRFVEMIGIIALLEAVVMPSQPRLSAIISYVLILLSVLYLIEPLQNFLAGLFLKGKPTWKKIAASVTTIGVSSIVSYLILAPIISALATLIRITVSH